MKSVLICDDEQLIRKNVRAMLSDLGFEEIHECADGDADVAAALDKIPDIIIMDVSMPKKDGITAATEIRKRLKVPVIFLTAQGSSNTTIEAVQSAAHPHTFLGHSKHGQSAIFVTKGNPDCHVILRGGKTPNYDADHVAGAVKDRKDGLKIYYAIKHPEILEVVDLVTMIVKQEISGRHELLKAV